MTPADMLVPHDPLTGTWGDCTRCCVASIFDLPAEQVPHFAEHGEEPRDEENRYPWERRLRAWLAERGMAMMIFRLHGPEHEFAPECLPFHYIRGGQTARGTNHDTVWFGGQMVHDPHPSRAGIEPAAWPQDMLVFVKA